MECHRYFTNISTKCRNFPSMPKTYQNGLVVARNFFEGIRYHSKFTKGSKVLHAILEHVICVRKGFRVFLPSESYPLALDSLLKIILTSLNLTIWSYYGVKNSNLNWIGSGLKLNLTKSRKTTLVVVERKENVS